MERTVALGQMKFCTLKDHGHTYKFYLNRYSLMELLNMAVFQNFEVMFVQMLNYFV
jgi:hypothetical protein